MNLTKLENDHIRVTAKIIWFRIELFLKSSRLT